MEAYDFTVFEHGPIERSHERMHVTIDKRGRLFFNKVAFEALGKPVGVVLMFDEKKKAIGVLPATLTRREAFRLKTMRGSAGKFITALNFCRHFSISASETLAFHNPRLNHDGILILSLHEVQPVSRRWAESKKK